MKHTGTVRWNFSACIKLEIVLVACIIFFTVIQQDTLVSVCFALSFIVLLIYTLDRIARKKFNLAVLLLILLAIVNVVLNAGISAEAVLGFNYFKKVIMFAAFILSLYFAQEDEVSESAYKTALLLPCICAVGLVFSYFIAGNTVMYGGGITLGFSNPNFTGMWLLHLLIYMFLFVVSCEYKLWIRVLAAAMLIPIAWLLVQTRARSCLVGLVVFAGLIVLGLIFKPRRILRPVILAVIILFPILVVVVYQSLLEASWFQNLFAFLTYEGKGLDARLRVWNPAILSLKEHVLLGDYCGISDGTGSSQLHNTHLDVVCSYGLIPFLLFLKVLFGEGKKMLSGCTAYFNYFAICGYFAIIATGAFEAAVVAGAMGMNLLTAGLVLLANRPVNKG